MNSFAFDPGTDQSLILTVTVHGHVVDTQLIVATQPRRSPMYTLITALGECALITLHGICQRQRQSVTAYRAELRAAQRTTHPQILQHVQLHFVVMGNQLDMSRLTHAVALLPKYCPVHATVACTSPIHHSLTIDTKDTP
ncbi:MAG: peroxiredoxin [Chloroflexota bacterium]|jgi:uncharacterized OsmC-like protein